MKKFIVRILCCFVPTHSLRSKLRNSFNYTDDILKNLELKIKKIENSYTNIERKIQDAGYQEAVIPDVIMDENHNIIFKSGLFSTNNDRIKFENNAYCLQKNIIAPGTVIGKYSYLGSYTKIDNNVKIGSYCSISDNVLIGATIHPQNWLSTSPFQYDGWLDPECNKRNWEISKETVVGNDVWIGAHVIIKSGVVIGDGAIIGAGAVVTHDVPPYAIVVGVPAKIIRYRFDSDTIAELLAIKWWNLPQEKIRKLPFDDIKQCLKEIKNEFN